MRVEWSQGPLMAALALAVALAAPLGESCGPGGAAAVLSLPQAIRQALRQRPLLEAEEQRIGAAAARVTQARSARLPRVEFQASITDGPLGAPPLGLGGVVGTPIKKHYGASLNLTQTLIDFGRARQTVAARRSEADGQREALRADENRVVLEVQQAYYQALQAQRLLAVNRQILEQRQQVARQAEILRENGLATRLDVDLAELNVSQALLALTRAESDVEPAFASLAAAIGRPVPTDTVLEDIAPVEVETPLAVRDRPVPAVAEATAMALRERPELKQLEAQAQANERLAEAARAGGRPLVTTVASVGKINPSEVAPRDKIYAVGAGLTVPIYTGGLIAGQVEEARRTAAAARASRDELANQIRSQVARAVANLAASDEALGVAHAQLTRARDALDLATQRYQTQLGTILEVTQAQVGYATAQNDFVTALYDRELAGAALDFTTGRRH